MKWYDANECLIFNELYLTERAAKESRKLLDLMYKLWINLDPIYDGSDTVRGRANAYRKEIQEHRAVWKVVMKEDLLPRDAVETVGKI